MLTKFDALCKTLNIDSSAPSMESLSKLIHWCETTISTDQQFEGDLGERFASYKALATDFLGHIQPNIQAEKLTTPVPAFKDLTPLQFLVDKGLDIYLKTLKPSPEQLNSQANYTLLQLAAARGNLHMTENLLSLGANPREKTPNGHSILFDALMLPINSDEKMKQKKQAIYSLLSQQDKTALQERNESGDSVLHLMSQFGYDELVKATLTQAKQLAYTSNNLSHFPIHSAILSGQQECVKLLLAVEGVDELTDDEGRHALHYAAQYGDKDMVKRCLNSKTLDSADRQGQTPLILATIAHNLDAINELLAFGAQINLTDNESRSALHYAVESNDVDGVKRLLTASNIDVNLSDYDSHTPLDLIQEHTPDGESIKNLLTAHGASKTASKNGKP